MTLRRFMVLLKGLPYESNWVQFVKNKDNYSLATYNPDRIKV